MAGFQAKCAQVAGGLFALAAGLALWVAAGCGKGTAPSTTTYYSHYHPAGWMEIHPTLAETQLDQCRTCHEMNLLRAGNGVPGCLASACHHRSTPSFGDAAVHGALAKRAPQGGGGGMAGCQMCHGTDFTGGPSTSACQRCHDVPAPHPAKPWRDTTGSGGAWKHSDTDPVNAPVCLQCHFPGAPANPIDPATGLHYPKVPALPGSATGCFNNTMCHGTEGHPVPFQGAVTSDLGNRHETTTAAVFTADCGTCHALTGSGANAAAPGCTVCHTAPANDVTAPATGTGTCLSCHAAGPAGLPQGPTGTAVPDIQGSHPKHMALPGLTCDACHQGVGSGTLAHYGAANARLHPTPGPPPVAFDPVYNARTGPAAWNAAAFTCANVSCHGGQTTPHWRTGTLPAPGIYANCQACHRVRGSSTPSTSWQYNDATGRHASPGEHKVDCTYCHAMANGSPGALAHYKYLATQAVDGTSGSPADQLPSGTINFTKGVAASVISASPTPVYSVSASTQGQGGCTLRCHSEDHTASDKHW